MSCEIKNRDDLIVRYLSGEMSDTEMLDFETHYFDCQTCYNALKLLETGVAVIRQEGASAFEKPATPWYHRFKKWFSFELPSGEFRPAYGRLALTAVFLGLLTFAPFLYQDYQIGQTYGENFTPHGFLESRISQFQRSTTSDLTLTPVNDANVSGEVLFRWEFKNAVAVGNYELLIFDNQRQEIFRRQISGSEYRLQEVLTPGLYYWVLLDETDQLHIGRFYYRRPFFFAP